MFEREWYLDTQTCSPPELVIMYYTIYLTLETSTDSASVNYKTAADAKLCSHGDLNFTAVKL